MFSFGKFYGGVHPDDGKIASGSAIEDAPLVERYVIPLRQHIGAPASPVVAKGDKVLRGQLLAQAGGFVSAPVHSPTSGKIVDITTCLGPMGNQLPAVVLESDGEDQAAEPMPPMDWHNASPADLKKRVGDAGLVGMGGASFPTIVKLSPPADKPIDTLIMNGVECEPCLTADHRLMLEHPDRVLTGAEIVAKILGVKRIVIGIERNKPDAIALLNKLIKAGDYKGIEIHDLPMRYPQGAEKQLIFAITGRQVPSGGLPMDVGCVVQNVGSAATIAEAVGAGKPFYERITTVVGTPLVRSGNWRTRVGMSYKDAITLAGGVKEDPAKVISGGPMMGFSVYSLDIPIMKNTSGILLLSASELSQYSSGACIRCGRCNDGCPMSLTPGLMSVQIENEHYDMAEKWHVMDCIECGCCAYSCPAHRPLVQHMRRAKSVIAASRRAAENKK